MSNLYFYIREFLKVISKPITDKRREITKQKIEKLKGNPKELASFLYERSFGRPINWDNPVEWNEKLRWLQFYTDISIWTLLADKYLVRNYLQQKGYKEILVKLYGIWYNAEDIDFNSLPQSFVLKTNHGYGEVIVVQDKSLVNVEEIRSKIQNYLDTPFGYETAETHYLKIRPCIIAEELLPSDSTFSSSIVDYKFYCFDGKPIICGVYFNRNSKTRKTSSVFFDMDWNIHHDWKNPNLKKEDVQIHRPITFELMKRTCRSLCCGMPFCRLDFYEANGKLYFGEFTFTPASCTGGSLNQKIFLKLGNMMLLRQYPSLTDIYEQ